MQTSVSKKNLLVHIVVDCADTQFSNFAIEFLHESEKFANTDFGYSYGVQVEYFKQKNIQNLVAKFHDRDQDHQGHLSGARLWDNARHQLRGL